MIDKRASLLIGLIGFVFIFSTKIASAELAQLQKKAQEALKQSKALSQDLLILNYLQQKFSGGVWSVSVSSPTLADIPRLEIKRPAVLAPAPVPTFIYVPLVDDSGHAYQSDDSGLASLQVTSSLLTSDKQAAIFSFPPENEDLPAAVRVQKFTDPTWTLATYVNSLGTDAEKRAVFPHKKLTFERFILKRGSTDEVGGVQVKINSNTYEVPIEMGGACETTGGTISEVSQSGLRFRIHTFTFVGTNTFSVSGDCSPMDILLVAGGGGGGGHGGGGGGGLLYLSNQRLAAGPYNISVGNGGAAGENGSDSSLTGSSFSQIAVGGGGGAARGHIQSNSNGKNGGSGGGAGSRKPSIPGSGTENQGHSGGKADYIAILRPRKNRQAGGGGGGAESSGGDAWRSPGYVVNGGDGGAGRCIDIVGRSVCYAGGGGAYPNGTGGIGGGGNGVSSGSIYTGSNPGSGGLGGGGGGGGGGSSGGSGIVIIRYPVQ